MSSYFLVSGRPYAVATPAAPVPVAGAELLTNGGFAAWTAGAPDWWTVTATAPNAITQVGTGESYGGAGTGSANIYRANSTGEPILKRTPFLSVDTWYSARIDVSAINSGKQLIIGDVLYGFFREILATGNSQIAIGRAKHTMFHVSSQLDGTDATIDNLSLVPLTLSSLISTQPYASPDCDLSAAVTRTAGTQAGISARVDSAASPANFLIAYLDGAGNVKLDKCVAGTYTNLVSGAVTYGANKLLRLLCSGTSVSVYYDGTQVGTTQTVSDAGIVNNLYHGLFSTYASNAFASYTASSWVAVTP